MRNHLRTVPVSPERRQVEMKHEPGARGTEDSSPPVSHAPDSPPRSVPKVGLEPTPSCEDRILSPARLPFRHFGLPQSLHGWPAGVKACNRTVPDSSPNDESGTVFTSMYAPAFWPRSYRRLKNAWIFWR